MRINSLSPVNSNYMTGNQTTVQSIGTDQPQMQSGAVEASVRVATNLDMSNVHAANVEEASAQGFEPMSEELLNKSIQQANKNLAYQNRVIERAVHDVTKAVMYTVKDTVTHEVIAEFPPKRIQDMIAKMWELAGLFVDEKA